MYRNVLIGYDGSASAKDALSLALRFVDRPKASLTLVYTYPYSSFEPITDGGTYLNSVREHAHEILQEGKRTLPAGVKVETLSVAASSPAHGLSFLAEEDGYDLMILGSTHHGQIGRIILGSTGERLVHSAPCAVAVAPKDLRTTAGFRRVGVAFDGSPESKTALTRAYDIAESRGAEVTLYTVTSPPRISAMPGAELAYSAQEEFATKKAKEILDDALGLAPSSIDVKTSLLTGDPEKLLIEKPEGAIDIMVMGSRNYGPIKRALLGSVSTALLRKAPFPVLIIPRGVETQEPDSS